MKTKIFQVVSILNLLLFVLLLSGSTSGDNAVYIGKDAYLIEDGTALKTVYGGNEVVYVDKASGDMTLLSNAVLTSTNIWVNPTVGVFEKFYVEGDTRLKGATYQDGVIKFVEQGSNTNPSGGSQVLIYMKSDKLVIAYDDGGTAKYRTLDLTGTDGLFSYSTSAP